MLILLRLLHVVLGALWVGMFFFMTFYLAPALEEAGPSGGPVVQGLQRRGMMHVLPIVSIITLLSGGWMYWMVSDGLNVAYVHSTMGRTLALGGVFAILAWVIGMAVLRPAMMRGMALAASLGMASESERAAGQVELARLRARGATAGRVIAGLLLAAAASMSIARYL